MQIEHYEQLLLMQRDVLEMVALDEDSTVVLATLCRLSESMLPGAIASIMLFDKSTGTLNVRYAPNLPEAGIEAFSGLIPGPFAASCGTAMYLGEAVFVSDATQDPLWASFSDIAMRFGLRACWSAPIRNDSREAIGTFALTSFEQRTPEVFHKRLLDTCAQLAGIILKRQQQEEKLRLASIAFENISEGVVVTDEQHRVVEVNEAFERITGYCEEELIGSPSVLLVSDQHDEAFFQAMVDELQQLGGWSGEFWGRRKNGEIYPQWVHYKQVSDLHGGALHHVAVVTDLSEIKRSEKKLWELANYDPLTGLPNRLNLQRQLEDSIKLALQYEKNLALLVLDLDDFKHINDSFGHHIGDQLLQQVARRLRFALRKSDFIGRLGGDVFAVLLQTIDEVFDIERVAEKLREALRMGFQVGGEELIVKPSMGISLFPQDGVTAEVLLKNADTALHQAKQMGRNLMAFYSPEQTAIVRDRVNLESDMRRALEKNQFFLHYQPFIDVRSGAIAGAEALLRWKHPERGFIPPDKFIPLAEDSGFICELGRWVLQQACQQAVLWHAQGFGHLIMAVNLSGHQLNLGCVDTVKSVLLQTGMRPSHLELEITETSLMERGSLAVDQIRQLRALGISLAMDDFGTGHSSMSQLKLLPISKLKIDRSFIRDIPGDANDIAITEAISALARALGLRVTAEGVETAEQKSLLEKLGCDQFQGYLFSRPVSADEFTKLLQGAVSQVSG